MMVYIIVCTINGEPKMCPFESVTAALKFVRTATSETRTKHMIRVDEHGNVKIFKIGFTETLLFVSVDEVLE